MAIKAALRGQPNSVPHCFHSLHHHSVQQLRTQLTVRTARARARPRDRSRATYRCYGCIILTLKKKISNFQDRANCVLPSPLRRHSSRMLCDCFEAIPTASLVKPPGDFGWLD